MDTSKTEVTFFISKKYEPSSPDFLFNFFLKYSQYIASYKWNFEQPLISSIELKEMTKITSFINTSGCRVDQWSLVQFLMKMTDENHFLYVSVTDEDGQFMLIEAANELPSWLEPDTSNHRVWIYKGQVVVIPKNVTLNSDEEAALYLSKNQDLISSPKINKIIQKRFDSMNTLNFSSSHFFILTLPSRIVYFLNQFENSSDLINLSLHHLSGFLANPLDKIKNLRKLGAFNFLIKDKGDMKQTQDTLVDYALTLTKFQYAFLKNCEIPRFQYKMENRKSNQDSFAKLKETLGVKLTFALELTIQEYKSEADFVSGTSNYLESFPFPSGEFPNQSKTIERAYKRLLSSSLQNEYTNAIENLNHFILKDYMDPEFVQFRTSLLDQLLGDPDDESWIFLTPDELDEMMNPKNEDFTPVDEEIDERDKKMNIPKNVKERIKSFFKEESSFMGVETDRKKRNHSNSSDETQNELPLKDQSSKDNDSFNIKDLIKSLDDNFASDYPESMIINSKEREFLYSTDSSQEESILEMYSKDDSEQKKSVRKAATSKKRNPVISCKAHPRGSKKPIDKSRLCNKEFLPNDSSDDEELFKKLYFDAMEEELAQHPASIGRKYHSKKAKQSVPLAEEEINSSDEDIEIFTESLLKEMPSSSNPGSNLLSSMGLPVHQMFAASSLASTHNKGK